MIVVVVIIIVVVHSAEAIAVIIPTNVPAHSFAGILIIAKVNPAKYASVGDIVDDVSEIVVLDHDPWRTGMRHVDRLMPAVGSPQNLEGRAGS